MYISVGTMVSSVQVQDWQQPINQKVEIKGNC